MDRLANAMAALPSSQVKIMLTVQLEEDGLMDKHIYNWNATLTTGQKIWPIFLGEK